MALNPYTPNADNAAQPSDSNQTGTAARELRALKQKVNELQTTVRPATPTGTANALIVAEYPAVLTPGRIYYLTAVADNTGPVTLAPGGSAAIPVRQADSLTNLNAGEIKAGQLVMLQYVAGGTPHLRLVSGAAGVPGTNPGFSFPADTEILTYLGNNIWRVTLDDMLVIYNNCYSDGTVNRYITTGYASIYVFERGVFYSGFMPTGVAGAAIDEDDEVWMAVASTGFIGPIHDRGVYYSSLLYTAPNYNQYAGLTSVGGFKDGQVYTIRFQSQLTPMASGNWAEPTLHGYPLYMQVGVVYGPVLPSIIQRGPLYRVMFVQNGIYPDGLFVLQQPESGWIIDDYFSLQPSAPYMNGKTQVNEFRVIPASNGFSITVGAELGATTAKRQLRDYIGGINQTHTHVECWVTNYNSNVPSGGGGVGNGPNDTLQGFANIFIWTSSASDPCFIYINKLTGYVTQTQVNHNLLYSNGNAVRFRLVLTRPNG